MQNDSQIQSTAELTEREQEILRLVATGTSNKDIARQLFISSNTVKVHLRNIFSKIGVASRTEAAMYAIRTGVAQSPVTKTGNEGQIKDNPDSLPARHKSLLRNRFVPWGISGALLFIIVFAIWGLRAAFNPAGATLPTNASSISPATTSESRWHELSAMPTYRGGLAVASYADQIYTIGGETAEGVTGVVEQFDPATGRWKSLLPKPLPVADASAAVIGGQILVPGGRTSSGEVTNKLEIYDPSFNIWEESTPLPKAVSAYALVAFEGRLYLFGGWDGQEYINNVFQFDPENKKWAECTSMLTSRGFAGATIAGGKIFILGGRNEEGALDLNEVYHPDRDVAQGKPWSQATPLPDPRYAMGVASVADIIHIIGGKNESEETLPFLEYFPQSDKWQSLTSPIAQPRSHLGLATLESYLYILGGMTGDAFTGKDYSFQAIYTVGVPFVP